MLVSEEKAIKALKFWSRYFAMLYSNLDADDLFQEAYIGTVQTITNEHHINCAVRCDMLDYIRREFRFRSRFEIHSHETLPEKEVESTCNIERLDMLDKIIAEADLDEVQKRIIFFIYYRHLTMEQVAAILTVSKSTISIQHKNTLARIRSTFDD